MVFEPVGTEVLTGSVSVMSGLETAVDTGSGASLEDVGCATSPLSVETSGEIGVGGGAAERVSDGSCAGTGLTWAAGVPVCPGGTPVWPGGAPAGSGSVPTCPGGVPTCPGGVPTCPGGAPAGSGSVPT